MGGERERWALNRYSDDIAVSKEQRRKEDEDQDDVGDGTCLRNRAAIAVCVGADTW